MNFYEIHTTDGASFMIQLETIETVVEFPDYVRITTVSGRERNVTHGSFSAALVHSKSGYFKIEGPQEVEEEDTVVVEGVEVL